MEETRSLSTVFMDAKIHSLLFMSINEPGSSGPLPNPHVVEKSRLNLVAEHRPRTWSFSERKVAYVRFFVTLCWVFKFTLPVFP
jgi:hypothetical protein